MQTKRVISEARTSTKKYCITIILYQELLNLITIILYQELLNLKSQSKQNRNFKIKTDFGAPLVWRTGKSVPFCPLATPLELARAIQD